MTARLDVVGIAEVSELLRLNRKTVRSWLVRKQMPQPDAWLACGPVWRTSTISKWAAGAGKSRVGLHQQLGERVAA